MFAEKDSCRYKFTVNMGIYLYVDIITHSFPESVNDISDFFDTLEDPSHTVIFNFYQTKELVINVLEAYTNKNMYGSNTLLICLSNIDEIFIENYPTITENIYVVSGFFSDCPYTKEFFNIYNISSDEIVTDSTYSTYILLLLLVLL